MRRGRAVVLPGGGVAPPVSPLDHVVRVLDDHAYDVRRIWWDAPQAVRDPHAAAGPADDWVRAQAERSVVGWDAPVLVVGKSLGTRAVGLAAERGWPGIWVTPLLVAASVTAAIATNPAPQLLVCGTADPFLDVDVARSLESATCRVEVVAGADHALVADGRPCDISTVVAAFLGFLASWPA